MLPKLSERASARCTANKQAEIRQSGEGLQDMEDFIALNKEHLTELREMIAEGERVCIDAGWPQLGAESEAEPAPEPEVIIKEVPVEVEKIVEVEVEKVVEVKVKDPETEAQARAAEEALTEALDQLKAAKAKVDDRKPEPVPDEPPEGISDLFDPNLTARQNQEALLKKYAALMSEREHELTAGNTSKAMDLLKRAERIESGITWNRARLAEVI